ncbi:MAG: NAD(P)H-binding protein [Ruminococcaceae bacterium]|nr:NAD(P)H-binding protein [Oscillospiraceae bacterium]
MKITVIGASGRLGSLIVKEALSRGHEVTAAVRDVYFSPDSRIKVMEGDIFDLEYDDVWDQDVIIDAFGVWEADKADQHRTTLEHLCDIMSGKSNRLIIVGGNGNLFLDETRSERVIDKADYPKAAYPIALAMVEAYDNLKKRYDVQWTYVCPALDFKPDEKGSGIYRISGDILPYNHRGKSEITYEDFAVAIIDEAEKMEYIGEQITVYEV